MDELPKNKRDKTPTQSLSPDTNQPPKRIGIYERPNRLSPSLILIGIIVLLLVVLAIYAFQVIF